MPEEKRKINAWIPVSLYNQIERAGYENITQAIIKALERLLLDPQEDTEGYKKDIEGYLQDIEGYKQDIASLTDESHRLNEEIRGYKQKIKEYEKKREEDKYQIHSLQNSIQERDKEIKGCDQDIKRLKEDLAKAPDPVTFAQLQARFEGVQEIIREKDRSIERLENDLRKAERDKEDLKATYNNYFLQVQTLINQKAIGTGSTRKEEGKPAKEEENSSTMEDNSSPKNTKNTLEIVCLNCGEVFTTGRSTRKFCSSKCKTAYYRKKIIIWDLS